MPNRLLSRALMTIVLGAATAFAAGGCTHANRRLNVANLPIERRAQNRTLAALAADVAPLSSDAGAGPAAAPADIRPEGNPAEAEAEPVPVDLAGDGCFVGLAISGGGSRSANFAAACMFQLQRLGLLQRVDYISSVSGGSLTAAYYCAQGDDAWNPGTVQRKLTHSFANDLILQTLLPWNLVTLVFTDYDRSDLLARSFTNHLFSRGGRELTFADLRPDRPRLLVNATDLQSGRKFVFTNESFDELNSDLSRYPLSYAVAASSAVPVLMHHVTLRDYSTVFKQYRHLIDGGINDNLGVQSLVETYHAQVATARAAGRPDPYPRGAALIVLDARTEFDARLSDRGDIGFIESFVAGAGLTSTALLNRASSATLADIIVRYSGDEFTAKQLRGFINTLNTSGHLSLNDTHGKRVRVLHMALSRVKDLGNLPYSSFRERVNSIETYFNIGQTEAFNLYQAADLLVREQFETQLADLCAELDGRQAEPPATEPATE